MTHALSGAGSPGLERLARGCSWLALLAALLLASSPQFGPQPNAVLMMVAPPLLALMTLLRNTGRWLDWLAFATNLLVVVVALFALGMWTAGYVHSGRQAPVGWLCSITLSCAAVLTVAALGTRVRVGQSSRDLSAAPGLD